MFVPLTPLHYYRRAERLFGKKTGVVDGDLRLTYAQFADRVERLAAGFRRLGIGEGDRVSLLCHNTHHLLESYYAVPLTGAVLNPLNTRLSAEELGYIVQHAGARVLCFHAQYLPLVEGFRHRLASLEHLVVIEGDLGTLPFPAIDFEELARTPERWRPSLGDIDENTPCELFYTSGTTAHPKGVLLTHRGCALHALQAIIAEDLRESDVFLHIVPAYHANGWGSAHTVTAVGATHVMLRKVDPEVILQLIERERATYTMGVPTVFNMLVNSPALGKYDTSSLRRVVSGGAPVPAALVRAVEEKLGGRCIQAYGLTESGPLLTLAIPKSYLVTDDASRREWQSRTGIDVVGVEVRVVDEEGNDVPRDGKTLGEIIARGNTMMDGYYRDPAGTAETIVDGWLRTGDMAVMDEEGYIQIKDRKKDIIISGGLNISSAEVEEVLYEHPAVYQCAVIAVPDEHWGELPKAVVVLKDGASATPEELIAFCRDRLAHFKAPKSVDIVGEMPISGTGKILKRELRERYWVGYESRVR